MARSEIKLGATLSYVIIIVNTLIGLFYTPFLTGMMGQNEYGLYSLAASTISYLTILDFGFGNAITVYTSKYLAKKDSKSMEKLHGMFFVIYCFIGLLAAVGGILLTINVENLFGQTMTPDELFKGRILMAILTLNLLITFPFSIFNNIIVAHEKFIFNKCVALCRSIIQPLIMIPLLLLGYKSIALVILITILNLTFNMVNVLFCIRKLNFKLSFHGFDKVLFTEIVGYSVFIFLWQIIDKINWSVDNFILGAICGTSVVAVYAVAAQFNSMYLSFSTAISSVLLPKVSKMDASNASDEEFTNVFIKTGRIQTLILGLVLTGFVLFGKQFILFFFGVNYEDAYIVACILMIPVSIPLIQNVGLSILQAKNRVKFRVIVYLLIAVGNVALSIFLANDYGPIGVAIGTGASFILGNFIIMNTYYHKKIGINIIKFWKEILKEIIPIFILFVVVCFIIHFVVVTSVVIYVVEIIFYTLLYCVVSWFFIMNGEEKKLIKIFNKS